MELKIVHIDQTKVQAKSKLPLHKDPEYLANLKRDFVAMHNEKIRKQKNQQLPAAGSKSVNF